ncbi:MAG: M48 family metallopeptidase [Anaerolineae bacterium]
MAGAKPLQPTEIAVKVGEESLTVSITPDARLKRNARWSLRGDQVTIRVPLTMKRADIAPMVQRIVARIETARKRGARRSDKALMQRANEINAEHFEGELSWRSIRWVENMQHRLGSCTTGGATDGDIRLSTKLRRYPDYVIDYVLAHELCHRKYPNHSVEFWAYLARFPQAERARGFLEGVAYADGADADSLLD